MPHITDMGECDFATSLAVTTTSTTTRAITMKRRWFWKGAKPSLTRTERNANAPPNNDPIEAIKKPGQTPYANPMRLILAENPNSGGWDESTAVA
jgi:hypothetical protein